MYTCPLRLCVVQISNISSKKKRTIVLPFRIEARGSSARFLSHLAQLVIGVWYRLRAKYMAGFFRAAVFLAPHSPSSDLCF
jgi:hypothetical protein